MQGEGRAGGVRGGMSVTYSQDDSDETNDRNTSSQYFCICPTYTYTEGSLHLTFLYTGGGGGCPLFAESSNGLG